MGTFSAIKLWAYYNCDTSTIRVRFDYDSATTHYNTLRGFSCARIRDAYDSSAIRANTTSYEELCAFEQ